MGKWYDGESWGHHPLNNHVEMLRDALFFGIFWDSIFSIMFRVMMRNLGIHPLNDLESLESSEIHYEFNRWRPTLAKKGMMECMAGLKVIHQFMIYFKSISSLFLDFRSAEADDFSVFLLTISGHASPSGNGETLCRLCTEERSPRESSGSRMYLFSHDWNGRYSCSGLRAVCHSGICFRLSAGPVLNHPTCIPDHSFASQGTIASYHQYIIGLYCLRRFYYNAILNLYIKKNQKASLHL